MDIQTLLDIEEIKQLRYSFAWSLETSDPDQLADLFTPDGVVDVGPWGRMDGQQAIRKGYGRAYKDMPQFTAMHAVTNPRIRVNGDEATGTWYLLDMSLRDPGIDPLQIVGIYDEIYCRTAAGWRIRHLTLRFLWSSEHGRITEENPMTIPARTRAAHGVDRRGRDATPEEI
ncbi:MAG: nuclear transport factor 2 family protein [Novosphingobium sp.]|nr:nuclear transport factor 2 family protein [Novosphingobium sp.]